MLGIFTSSMKIVPVLQEDGAERTALVTTLVDLINHDLSDHGYPVQIPYDYPVSEHEVEDGFYHSIVLRIPESSENAEFSCHIKGRRQGSICIKVQCSAVWKF